MALNRSAGWRRIIESDERQDPSRAELNAHQIGGLVSWLNDIKKQKSEEDSRKRAELIRAEKRVREKAKNVNPIVLKLLDDFGKACWGGGLFSQSYAIKSGLSGRNWVWIIEHLWDEHGITNSAGLEVHLMSDPRTGEFEFMLVQPEKLSDVGPRYPCNQAGLKEMLREVYEIWLKEPHRYNLKAIR